MLRLLLLIVLWMGSLLGGGEEETVGARGGEGEVGGFGCVSYAAGGFGADVLVFAYAAAECVDS